MIRLQAVYSAVAMGGSIRHHDRLRRFPLSAPAPGRILGDGPADAPGDGYTAKSGGGLVLEHGADMLLLAFSEVVLRVDQRRRKQRQRRR